MDIKRIKIDGVDTEYYATDSGVILSTYDNRVKILKTDISNCGYERVTIYVPTKSGKNKPRKLSVHRLVAITFIPNDDVKKTQINHIDDNKLNNHVSNLEWVTPSENDLKAYELGLKQRIYGNYSHMKKYTKKQVIEACELMESGDYNMKEISLLTGIEIGMIRFIQSRKSWVDVSANYDVENCKKNERDYKLDQIEAVFKLLEENELSVYDISSKTNVEVTTIRDILRRKRVRKKFEYLYDIYDVSKYEGNKPSEKTPVEVTESIKALVNGGYDNKYIRDKINKRYGINKTKINAIIIRFRKQNNS